jgi:asparagine synthase (glutamine-hydrolysing)
VRTPLTDVRVAELAATIPPQMQAERDGEGRWRGKLLLRRVLAKRLPSAVLDRPKRGFGVPLRRWFADPALAERLRSATEAEDAPLRRWFADRALRSAAARPDRGPAWLLVVLDEWLRRFRPELP